LISSYPDLLDFNSLPTVDLSNLLLPGVISIPGVKTSLTLPLFKISLTGVFIADGDSIRLNADDSESNLNEENVLLLSYL